MTLAAGRETIKHLCLNGKESSGVNLRAAVHCYISVLAVGAEVEFAWALGTAELLGQDA